MTAAPVPAASLDLNRLMALLAEAQEAACVAHAYARPPVDAEAARERIAAAQEAVESAMRRLRAAGVDVPARKPSAAADPLSLSALASLASKDTPAARSFLAALRGLLPQAEALDRERGNWYGSAPDGDTGGTDFAEDIHSLICRLELELSGPRSHRGE